MSLIKLQEKYGKLGEWSDCPEGWTGFVEQLLMDLNKIPGWDNKYISQIKEKFGTLRFYINFGDEDGTPATFDHKEVDKLIDAAEALSASVCEVCGGRGELESVRGWVRTVCKKHLEDPATV